MKRFMAAIAVAALLILPATVSGASDQTFMGSLSGAAQVPPVATTASGTAYVVINAAGDQLRWGVQYSGLSGALTGAHIHFGAAGANGQIMFPLTISASPMLGVLTAADFQAGPDVTTFAAALAAIRSGTAYVNLHTAAHPDGEIRAQLLAQAPAGPAPLPSPSASAQPAPIATSVIIGTPSQPAPRITLPPTATGRPLEPGAAGFDLAPVAALLALAMAGGLLATLKVRPSRRGVVDDDD